MLLTIPNGSVIAKVSEKENPDLTILNSWVFENFILAD